MKRFSISCRGHKNIRGTHRTTWEITRDNFLSPRGDCIIGISASHGLLDFPEGLKSHLKSGGEIGIILETGGMTFHGTASGHPDLELSHSTECVFRKSEFISERTAAINCSFAANDLPREMIELLQDEMSVLTVTIEWDDGSS